MPLFRRFSLLFPFFPLNARSPLNTSIFYYCCLTVRLRYFLLPSLSFSSPLFFCWNTDNRGESSLPLCWILFFFLAHLVVRVHFYLVVERGGIDALSTPQLRHRGVHQPSLRLDTTCSGGAFNLLFLAASVLSWRLFAFFFSFSYFCSPLECAKVMRLLTFRSQMYHSY